MPFTARWWNPPIFYPMPGALALSEHLAGIAIVTTPLQWAGVSPLAAYNVALILSFGLSGFFAFLLGAPPDRIGRSRACARGWPSVSRPTAPASSRTCRC